jgi:hypothetical protein
VDPGPFFYISITVYYLLVLFTFLQTTIFYHSICLILCLQQTGEIDNLTISWDKVLGCVVCRFHVAAGAKLRPGLGAIHTLSGAVAKLAGINLLKFGSFSYWFDKPWFHTEGRLAAVLITPSLGDSNWAVIYKTPTSTPHHHTFIKVGRYSSSRAHKDRRSTRLLRSSKVGRQCGDCKIDLNKGGGPRVPSASRQRTS